MLNGLDLFSGIGGISIALKRWVIPIAYCEIDKYARGVLLSRMSEGKLSPAPIWDDVRTFKCARFRGLVDIVYGGFPCQDISVAGTGKGLEGQRSGLFYEIVRIVDEIRPKFIFLENVPAIRTRGADKVVGELADLRYDARWITLSAAEIGANHKRERWWLLAHTMWEQQWRDEWESKVKAYVMANPARFGGIEEPNQGGVNGPGQDVCNSATSQLHEAGEGNHSQGRSSDRSDDPSWWSVEPNVGRVVNGLSFRVDRIKCLGNAVVPQQAKKAFEILMFGK